MSEDEYADALCIFVDAIHDTDSGVRPIANGPLRYETTAFHHDELTESTTDSRYPAMCDLSGHPPGAVLGPQGVIRGVAIPVAVPVVTWPHGTARRSGSTG